MRSLPATQSTTSLSPLQVRTMDYSDMIKMLLHGTE